MPATVMRTAAGFVLLLTACFFAASNDLQRTTVCLLLALLVGLDAGAVHRGHPWHSPPRFLAFALAASGLAGWFSVSATQDTTAFAVTSAHLVLDPTIRLDTLCFFLVTAAAALSAAVVRGFGPRARTGLHITQVPSWVLAAAAVPLVLMVIGISPEYLWRSPGYLSGAGPTLALKLGSALSIPGVAAAAGAMFLRRQRWSGTAVLISYEVVALAKGSRLLGILPMLVLATWLVTTRTSLRKKLLIGTPTILVALLALELPLTLRGLPAGGLAPYLSYIASHPSAFSLDVRPQLNNLLFGFDLTGYVGRRGDRLPMHDLAVSISPLPGGPSGWNSLSSQMRINPATPFNGLGELYNYGWTIAIMYVFVASAFLGEVRRQLACRIASGHLAGLFVTALGAILTVDLLQYNLRSTSRILYYAVVLIAVVIAIRKPITAGQQTERPGRGAVGTEAAPARQLVAAT